MRALVSSISVPYQNFVNGVIVGRVVHADWVNGETREAWYLINRQYDLEVECHKNALNRYCQVKLLSFFCRSTVNHHGLQQARLS